MQLYTHTHSKLYDTFEMFVASGVPLGAISALKCSESPLAQPVVAQTAGCLHQGMDLNIVIDRC